MKAKKVTSTLLLLALSLFLHAQLQVKNYFSFTGKKDIAVNAVCQDYQGFLWAGGKEGLYRFDGKKAVELFKESRLMRQEISALFNDIHDAIWVGTKNGKIYRIVKNRLDSVVLPGGPNTDRITSFCPLDSGLCVSTYGNGIYILTGKRVKHFTSDNGLSDNVVYKAESDRHNRVWCGTDAGVTELRDVFTRPLLKKISDANGLPDNIVRDLFYRDERLLIAMQDSGVCFYDLRKRVFSQRPVKGNWELGAVVNAAQLENGKILIATEKNGLVEINGAEKREYDYNNYLQAAAVNGMFVDNTQQLWLTSKKGLSHFTDKRFSLITDIQGLPDSKILAIAVSSNNAIWVGNSTGVSVLENGPGCAMAMGASHDLSKFTISCAATAPDGAIWYGSYGNGIIIPGRPGAKSIIINSGNSQLANDNISNIYFADKGIIYISTLGGGLIKAELTGNRTAPFKVLKTYMETDGLGNNYVYSAITDSQSRLFVATDGGGLQVMNGKDFVNLTKKNRLMSNTVFSLCRDKFNSIWAVSNNDGIIKVHGDSLITIGLREGLRDPQPPQIIAVDNTLYAFNAKGIDKINCLSNAVSYYDLFDNDPEPNLNAICESNGSIYSGTNNGILIFRTGKEHLDSIKPTAFVTGMQLNFKPFPLDSIYEFKYRQNNIALSFDGIWLKNPGKLNFRYRLNGLEENWQYADEGKTVNYNNLPPGEYTFILQSKNEEDVWSEPTGYYFVILTPLWKRWWFWVILVAVVSAGLYLFFRYRIRALQKQNRLLEQRVAERTREIEEQSRVIAAKNRELEQLSLVASKTDNVVLILDAEGRLEYVNESFYKLNNINPEDLKLKFGETIFEFSSHPNIRELVSEAINEKRSVHYESLNKHVESEFEVWASSTLTPIFEDNGALRKIIVIDADVSEIKKQEQIITQKNKDITDSISYARKIQHSILPRESVIRHFLPKSFVLYMTKDIVSGDFYWFAHFGDCSIIAAVDCTGHGVPGAFMSLIGYSLLNRIINEKKITDPGEILLELNNGVLGILHKNESESKDGMDIAICKINHNDHTLNYAGAMRPLWIISNGTLTEVKADKIPIGTKQKDRNDLIAYTTHTLPLKAGDCFYIFTDGYADQFGGSRDKKFSTARFKELLISNASLDFGQQEKNLRQEHLNWKGHNEQVDDILLIGFSV